MCTCQTIYTKFREKRALHDFTSDKQAVSKEQGISKHKKPEEASLDLKPHVALWRKPVNITIKRRKMLGVLKLLQREAYKLMWSLMRGFTSD
jgi:hypothetical protein